MTTSCDSSVFERIFEIWSVTTLVNLLCIFEKSTKFKYVSHQSDNLCLICLCTFVERFDDQCREARSADYSTFFTNTQKLAILASEALLREKIKSSNKILPQWVLNLGPQPFRSNALLSELSSHVLLGISLNCLLVLHHFNVGLRSTTKTWPYADLRSPKKHMPQKGEDQTQTAEVSGSMFTGVIFCCWIFCLHVVKTVMPILPLLPISAIL